MSAFNWIKFKQRCPNCKELAEIKAQSKMASSYDGLEDRFHDKEYSLGDTMKWWNENDIRYNEWIVSNQKKIINSKIEVRECCYSMCASCKSNLYAVIEFSNISPTKVIELGMEEEYPNEYCK